VADNAIAHADQIFAARDLPLLRGRDREGHQQKEKKHRLARQAFHGKILRSETRPERIVRYSRPMHGGLDL
jgi:hypothetical protein